MPSVISIVIATWNRCDLLAITLDALKAQQWPGDQFEIVVADNGSTDRTPQVVRDAARSSRTAIRYVFEPEPGKSFAVNRALELVAGDILALTDDDVRPEAGWLAALAGALEDPAIDFVAGRVFPIWAAPPPPWMSPALYGAIAIPDNGDRRVPIEFGRDEIMPIGANMAVRRSVLERLGGLRGDLGKLAGSLRGGEDHELFLRMIHGGCRGVYEPTAIVRHLVPPERLKRRYFRSWLYQNGKDVAHLWRAYPPTVPTFLGVPRYLWRQAFVDASTVARTAFSRDSAARFAAAVRLLWLSGHARESWFGHANPS